MEHEQRIYQRRGNGSAVKPASAITSPKSQTQPPTKPKPLPDDPWFFQACGQRTPLDLHLLNAEMIEGAIVTSISRYAFVLQINGQERCILKRCHRLGGASTRDFHHNSLAEEAKLLKARRATSAE